MNDPHELTIRVQALDGQWETLGADRYAGVYPEGVSFSQNEWGPDTLSFTLRRDPGAIHPDISTWTPIEVEVGGVVCWDGRVKETPANDGDDPLISVQCEGWQYHLDNDTYQANYVHASLSTWVDCRSIITMNLVTMVQMFNVEVGEGQILIGQSKDSDTVANTGGGVTLDLGEGCSAVQVSLDMASSNNTSTYTFFVLGHDTPSWTDGVGREDFFSNVPNNESHFSNPTWTFTSGIASPHRYWTFLTWQTTTGTNAGDVWFKVTGLRLFADTSYQSGGLPVLTTNKVVTDALSRTVYLNDTTAVQGGAYGGTPGDIPDFYLDGQKTAREVISAINAYENYETRVLVGRRVKFAPREGAATLEIGNWSGAEFVDASAGSGDEIYNKVVVQGTGPDGTSLSVTRFSSFQFVSVNPLTNPSATVDVSDWGYAGGVSSFVRDTTVTGTSTAPARFSAILTTTPGVPATPSTYVASFAVAETFTIGMYYRLKIGYILGYLGFTPWRGTWVAVLVNGVRVVVTSFETPGLNGPLILDWQQSFTGSNYQVQIGMYSTIGGSGLLGWDDVAVFRSVSTLADRRKFVRSKILPVSSGMTKNAAARIGDLYLAQHRTAPFKGSFRAVGLGGVRRILGGAPIHPAHITPGTLVRCSHRIDPDTGTWGRDGRVASVTYDHDSLTASVSLDENRAGLEALLSRLAVVTG